MNITVAALDEIKARARDASARAYAPYSRFAVGAAVLADDGRIYTGANVENASFGLTVCAERVAVFQAVADGARRIVAVAIHTSTPSATLPCGACRQVLSEFGADALIISCTDDDAREERHTLPELLPHPFGPKAP